LSGFPGVPKEIAIAAVEEAQDALTQRLKIETAWWVVLMWVEAWEGRLPIEFRLQRRRRGMS